MRTKENYKVKLKGCNTQSRKTQTDNEKIIAQKINRNNKIILNNHLVKIPSGQEKDVGKNKR